MVLPQDINAEASSLRFDLTPSIAGTLMSALDFLATYPYGCVEQTMSSFLPNILVAQATQRIGTDGRLRKTSNLKRKSLRAFSGSTSSSTRTEAGAGGKPTRHILL